MKRKTVLACLLALTAGAVVLVATADGVDPRAPFWPALDDPANPAVQEWYSDIPWHQKLGTFAGNEIDEALVLPYAAIPAAERSFCTLQSLSRQECMLETGVVNVLGMRRTDTLYSTDDAKIKAAPECQTGRRCIEVRLDLGSFWVRTDGKGIALVPRPFGQDPAPAGQDMYGGYVITDASTYAPQMPWYMSHYCDSQFRANANDVQDPVCYGDYLSPMNNGFNPLPKVPGGADAWPRSQPWSVYPPPINGGATNHCKVGEVLCALVMGGFDLKEVSSDYGKLQYGYYNDLLLQWFNGALQAFPGDAGPAENARKFPWSGTPVTWQDFLRPQAASNPFLGEFAHEQTEPPRNTAQCNVDLTGPVVADCFNTGNTRASTYLYPRRCEAADLANGDVAHLRACGLNYELHHNGYYEQWPTTDGWPQTLRAAGMIGNQYGRTSFLYAGLPGMQMPVSLLKDPASDSGMSIFEQVHNASLFSLFLPIANVADQKRAFTGRNYTNIEFYHTLLMSNHMESAPELFAQGIRGKVLWHNEYRTQKMYEAFRVGQTDKFPTEIFAGAFDAETAKSPYHNNTCDGCHVRNGSGVPINQAGKLDVALQEFMTSAEYTPYYAVKDYTFTGVIRPMKLVFFDLDRDTRRLDASRYSEPLSFSPDIRTAALRQIGPAESYYHNAIMNFYGDSFHATAKDFTFDWTFEPAKASRMVVATPRVNAELKKTYTPWQIKLGTFTTPATCAINLPSPTSHPWPETCADVNGAAIAAATAPGGSVGYLLLNGKRLGNLSAMEAIPNQKIIGFNAAQTAKLGADMAGEIIWNAGTRDGVNGDVQKNCRQGDKLSRCFIGRFGWIGDRASIEDQVANAAFVEMNMTTKQGYEALYAKEKSAFPLRYDAPNCGPADKACTESTGNGDLSELDVERMAEYARWLGNPTRSDLQVALPEVIAGEKIFKRVQCDTCHVIGKIVIDPDDTMLSKPFRARLTTHVQKSAPPFLSYIGTDLLMHDMGYLSQVAESSVPIRDSNGVLFPAFRNYVQKIRTPALKGLQYNRFVTESHKNTKAPTDPACDFLLHDGRACDAIEAAFLHDGPAVKKLGMIDALNALTAQEVLQLRAFLYSL